MSKLENMIGQASFDVVVVGSGASGLFSALNLPKDQRVLVITKGAAEESDSFLAQGGICVLRNEEDYASYFEDTLRAGHYENKRRSVDIMIRSSQKIISDLIHYGVEFEQREGQFKFTREGAHSKPRILFKQDVTGREIMSKLLARTRECENITLLEHTTMIDISVDQKGCCGIIVADEEGNSFFIPANYTVLATGGVGGLFGSSTNYAHLTGDALAIGARRGVSLKDVDYIQIHPTTLHLGDSGRRFLISESVRGEGAVLFGKNHNRFVDELLPRDVVSQAIYRQMEKDAMQHVWLSMEHIDEQTIKTHFQNIYEHCLDAGFDVTQECIPVSPAQHYLMGGIEVDECSRSSLNRLYAVGETSNNGVHGANRLASNSLLESLVFAKRAAQSIAEQKHEGLVQSFIEQCDRVDLDMHATRTKKTVLDIIEGMRASRAS